MARRCFPDIYNQQQQHLFTGDLSNCDFTGVFENLTFKGLKLDGSKFSGTFNRVSFQSALMGKVEINGEFFDCDFTGAHLQGCKTRGKVDGRTRDGRFVGKTPFVDADLSEADLRGGVFRGINFTSALFGSAILGEAQDGADLVSTTLKDAHLKEAQLRTASRLRCSRLQDGSRYTGQFNLYGDLADAQRAGVAVTDKEALARFYAQCE